MTGGESSLEHMLCGGDRRSIGAADEAARCLLSRKWSADEFLSLIEHASPVVRMRAADALEKATRESPALIADKHHRLLALLDSDQPKEITWHLLQMAPRLVWKVHYRKVLLSKIEHAFADPSAIVRTSALQALADLSSQGRIFDSAFRRRLAAAMTSKSPALRARARKLQKQAVTQAKIRKR